MQLAIFYQIAKDQVWAKMRVRLLRDTDMQGIAHSFRLFLQESNQAPMRKSGGILRKIASQCRPGEGNTATAETCLSYLLCGTKTLI